MTLVISTFVETVIGWALLYDEPVDEENFKEALSHTIADFPVVAGRFAGPAVINHNNAGVPLVICKDTRSAEVSNGAPSSSAWTLRPV